MFGKKEKDMAKNNGVSPATGGLNSINSLAKGTQIEGSVKTESDIRIDGTLNGDIECKGKLIVGPTGILDGTITCTNAVIEGTVKGSLTVKELLDVRETAKINGEIVTGKLSVQPNAIFNVRCQMAGQVLTGFNQNKSEKVG